MNNILKILNAEIENTRDILSKLNMKNFKDFEILCKKSIISLRKGKKIFFFGNGGSAADAQHLAAELVVKYKKKRKAVSAIALTTDTSILTAIGNDYSFDDIFSRQIEALGQPGDIALALTTSGNSKNIIQAIKQANKKKIITFCLSGNNGGLAKEYSNHTIVIPSKNTPTIQLIELMIGHVFCSIIEKSIK